MLERNNLKTAKVNLTNQKEDAWKGQEAGGQRLRAIQSLISSKFSS